MSSQTVEEKTKLISHVLQKFYKQKDMKKIHLLIQKAQNQSGIWKKISNPARLNQAECKTLYYKFIAPKVLEDEIKDEIFIQRQNLFKSLFADPIAVKKVINTDNINNTNEIAQYITQFIQKLQIDKVVIGKQSSIQLQNIGLKFIRAFSKDFQLRDVARGEKASVIQTVDSEIAKDYIQFLDEVMQQNKIV